jgi:hypothetical protein
MSLRKLYVVRAVHFELNCIMTSVMHMFLIYASNHLCLICFWLSFSPSAESGVQFLQWFKSPGYDVSARALTPYPGEFML